VYIGKLIFKVTQGHWQWGHWVHTYDLLLVDHCHHVAIFYRFEDTATYFSKF